MLSREPRHADRRSLPRGGAGPAPSRHRTVITRLRRATARSSGAAAAVADQPGHSQIKRLVVRGADVRARDRRGAEPLHAAAIGVPGAPNWDPAKAEQQVIIDLLNAAVGV
jgi:hypothetical protein